MTYRPGLHAWLAVACSALAAGPDRAHADDNKPEDVVQQMSLADVMQVAVRQAPDLARAAIETRTFNAFAKRALGAEDTKLTMSGDITRSDFEANNLATARAAITRLLPGGTIVQLKGDMLRGLSPPDPMIPGSGGLEYDVNTKLSITQPLLRGFGLVASNATKYVSRANRSATQLREMHGASTMVSRVVDAYWQLALTWRQLAVRRNAVEVAKKQLQYTEGAIKSGKIAGAEAIPVKQAIAQREQDVLQAEVDVWEQSMNLRVLVGMEIGPDVGPIATEELPEVAAIELDQRALIQQALDNNYDIAASTVGLGAFEAAVTGSRSQLLPKLDVRAELGPRGEASKFGNAVSDMTKFKKYALFASVDFEWNIDADQPEAEVQVQTQNLRGAEVDLRELKLQVAGDVATLIKVVEASAKSAELGKLAVSLAEDNVQAEQKKLEAGKSNNNEVLRRQDELQLARLRYANILANHQTARARLEVQTGAILATHGISYRPSK
jgi:outer membrane protein TolC